MRRQVWIVALALVLVAAAAGGVLIWRAGPQETDARVVAETSASNGWKTIEYRGVRVDIPSDWVRSDRHNCEFAFERWGEPDDTGCDAKDAGVAFYVSATFDPKYGPGLRPGDPAIDGVAWAGYVYAADYAVYVSGQDRGQVGRVLDSARPAD